MKRTPPPAAESRRPYKVFVSSTFLDNQERRKLVQDAITMAGMVWHGMEIFTASTRPTVEECLRFVREADLVVGIIAWRYGWEPDGNKSITEMEYDAAKQRLMFVIDPDVPVNPEKDFDPGKERWDKQKKLAAFKERIAADQMPALFIDTMLAAKVLAALNSWRDSVEPRLPKEAEGRHPVQWTKAPYPGLEAFKPEQAPIFFGRGAETDQLLELLRDPAIRFIAVAGTSGSGKSSLVAAGLIPRLRVGALRGSDQWVDIIFRPTERGDDPFLALAYALKERLGATGQRETELAVDLRNTPARFATCAGEILDGRMQGAELLLVVDQFEEVFTRVNADSRKAFIELIETASRTERVRLIATIRAEFTANVAEAPTLARLFRGRGYFLLDPPGPLALGDMIRRPAQLAGLELKDDLSERILKDTGTGGGALALMAFVLHEVYQRGKDSGRLTLQDYEALGGVSGAIKAQAERALQSAGQTDEHSMQALFSSLVEVSDQGVATRRRADLGEIRKDPSAARLADALVDARILVTGGEPERHSTIEVAHEAVFSAWPRLKNWIAATSDAHRLRRQVREAAVQWEDYGQAKEYLWPDERVVEAADILERLGLKIEDLSDAERCFLGPIDRDAMLAALDDPSTTHEIRATIGARLSLLGDPRPGVGLRKDGLPDIVWCEVPSGRITLEGGAGTFNVKGFYIAKYLVTWKQHRVFLDSDDGFKESRWWDDLTYHPLNPARQISKYDNHPAEMVTWEEAVAFCRWLTVRLHYEVRLPTEWEWEQAATGGNPENTYPWGPWDQSRANTYESELARSTAVGVYPHGASPVGALDMAGSLWEWCLNEYENPKLIEVPSGKPRSLRGGSWVDNRDYSRCACRGWSDPSYRDFNVGFRLVCASPIS
jgi:hypothetical protein